MFEVVAQARLAFRLVVNALHIRRRKVVPFRQVPSFVDSSQITERRPSINLSNAISTTLDIHISSPSSLIHRESSLDLEMPSATGTIAQNTSKATQLTVSRVKLGKVQEGGKNIWLQDASLH
jgi:hypothetical protein